MKIRTHPSPGRLLAALVLLVAMAQAAAGHAELIAPNGGELLDRGSTFTVEWTVTIEHSLENWDLWYSTTGPNGPWITIAMDLPPGDPSAGSKHTYVWTIPDVMSSNCYVRVRMDNSGEDYYDVSDSAFTMHPYILDAGGPSFNAGDTLTFKSRGTTFPGELFGLWAIDINGTPGFINIALGSLDSNGRWMLKHTVPSGLSGLVIQFQSYVKSPTGSPQASNTETLTFL